MGSLDAPASGPETWLPALGLGLFPTLLDMGQIVASQRRLTGRIAFVASVGAEVLLLPGAGRGTFDHDLVEGGWQ